MIRDEDGLLSGYVYVDMAGRDPNTICAEADRLLREKIALPGGYALSWSGDYAGWQRVSERLSVILPLTLFLIILLLYLNTKSLTKTFIVLLAVPFSAIGAFWFLYLLDYNLSIGVWVGLIALLGVDAETGVFMLLYLDLAYEKAKKEGRLRSLADLQEAIRYGAVQRLRPKFMTVATTFLGLVPILWAVGTGSDVMKRIAAPMIGGILASFLLELLVYPFGLPDLEMEFRGEEAVALMIELLNVRKVFNAGKPNEFKAIRGVDLKIVPQKVTVFKGPSGSGKTTLLSLIGCMARPTSGRIYLQERELTSLPERFLTEIRRKTFGFIFQQYNLVKGISVLENVMLPAYPLGEPHASLKQRTLDLLELLNIGDKATARVEWISGGQAQRVAVARALINNPSVIIADEPTAHLDTTLSMELVKILDKLKQDGKTVLIASHDPLVCDSEIVDHIIHFRDGKVDGDNR